MRVRMLRFGGIDGAGQKLLSGAVFDVHDELGEALVKDGRAILETTEAPLERLERAVVRKPGRPKRV